MRCISPSLLLPCILLIALFTYSPGLNGPFLFDDGLNIVRNTHLRIPDLTPSSLREAAFSSPAGIFQRPLSMLSFALNFYFQPDALTPFPFKLTNLAIHLLNGLMVFFLTRLLVGFHREQRQPNLAAFYPEWLALAVSAAWLAHPLNLTSVLYVVQRMNSLAALFTLIGLTGYVWGRKRISKNQPWGRTTILASFAVCAPLALLSKENGALLPLLMLVIEISLFKFNADSLATRRFLAGLFLLIVAVPILAFLGYIAMHPDWLLGGYLRRDFTLTERLMTEARVIWFYLRLIVLPDTAAMGVFHDDIAVSRGLLDPTATLPAILGIVALSIGIWLLRQRQPLIALGILFFFVGHSMESTLFPLELVHEHRNYLPMYGILLASFHLLLEPLTAPNTLLIRKTVAVLLIVVFGTSTFLRASDWANPFDLWRAEIAHHPDSPRTNSELGALFANYKTTDPVATEKYYAASRYYYERAAALQESNVNGLFGLIRLSISYGKEIDKRWLTDLNHRLEHTAIPANVNDKLIELTACQSEEKCPLSANEIESLIRATLRNPRVNGYNELLVNTALIFYLINVVQDYSAALEVMNRNIALAPTSFEHRLTLVKFLIALQRQEEATKQITLLKQVDRKGTRTKEIAELEKELAQGD